MLITFEEVKEKLNLDSEKYNIYDISCETERLVILENFEFTIKNPIALIIRKGGFTHRVIDGDGQTICYASPETGRSIIAWKRNDFVGF